MQLTYDSKFLQAILDIVSMKGKWLGSSGLINDSLGEYVKIVATGEGFRTGYYFLNANPQTFVSYYLPSIIEEEEECVLEIAKFQKYLKTMSGEVMASIGEEGCALSVDNKSAHFSSSIIHPHEAAINSFFKSKDNAFYAGWDLEPLTWGKTTLTNNVLMQANDFISAMKAVENVGHGVYKLNIGQGHFSIMSNENNEMFSAYWGGDDNTEILTMGEAIVDFTGPIHKSIERGSGLSIHFNDDSVIVFTMPNITIARAPYVVV
tara:strand:- start:2829 stop:3617 length:789 start_codon:yes stop_codon:yes gene_type:complete